MGDDLELEATARRRVEEGALIADPLFDAISKMRAGRGSSRIKVTLVHCRLIEVGSRQEVYVDRSIMDDLLAQNVIRYGLYVIRRFEMSRKSPLYVTEASMKTMRRLASKAGRPCYFALYGWGMPEQEMLSMSMMLVGSPGASTAYGYGEGYFNLWDTSEHARALSGIQDAPSTFDIPPGPLPEGAEPTPEEIREGNEFADGVRRGGEPITWTKLG